ncbi:MAG: hypothetical protein ACC608_00235 [Anaerofustis sp.]
MHLYKIPKKIPIAKIISVAAVLLLVWLAFFLTNRSSELVRQQQADLLNHAINRAVVSCYATEGRYPDSLDYIVSHYGVIIDNSKYYVEYDIFASNVKPSVRIIVKGANQ